MGGQSYTERLRWIIADIELEPVQRGYTDEGEPRIVFENVNQSGAEKFTEQTLMDDLSNFSLRLATRPDGRFTNATWRVYGMRNGEPVNRTETWTYEYGVNVSVTPDWLDTARREAAEIEVTRPNDLFYRIEYSGDRRLPPGTTISVLTPAATDEVQLDDWLEPADVIYLGAQNQTLQIYRSQPAGGQFNPLPERVSVGVRVGPANLMGDSHPESFRWREYVIEED